MIPTASTCINQLRLPRPSVGLRLLEQRKLFNLYDYAFTNYYFGQVWRLLVTLVNKPMAFWKVFCDFRNGFITNKKENLTQVFSKGRMLLHYRHFTENFNKKKLILRRFLICQKSVLVLNLFCIKGHLKLCYEAKILLLLVIFWFATFWQYFFFNEWFIEVTHLTV